MLPGAFLALGLRLAVPVVEVDADPPLLLGLGGSLGLGLAIIATSWKVELCVAPNAPRPEAVFRLAFLSSHSLCHLHTFL